MVTQNDKSIINNGRIWHSLYRLMSLYDGTEFDRSLLQFKHSIPFILSNYFFYPPGDTTTKKMMKSYNHFTMYYRAKMNLIQGMKNKGTNIDLK